MKRWRKILLWCVGISILGSLSLSARQSAKDDGTECAGNVQNDDNRFQHLFPPTIKTIAIVSPASPANTNEVDVGLRLLQKAGLRVKVMPHARENENSGYTSIAADKRIADLEQAWLDPEVDLILCTRGGVGSEQLPDKIDWDKLRQRDMPLVGFSNITALHCAMLARRAGHPYSGPSLTSLLGCNRESLARFRTTLEGGKLAPVPLQVLRPGACSGVAIGGHLMLLAKVSPTPFRPDTAGKIVFIECPGQTVAVMESKLRQLREDGWFTHCAGIVFGHFVSRNTPEEIAVMLRNFTRTVKCPVFSGYPYGHRQTNYLIDLRRAVTIDNQGVITP